MCAISNKKNTIKDVSKMAGVSVSTVSRYLNKSGYVSHDTELKLKAAIDQLNFTPNKMARGLKGNSIKEIMLIVPDITNPYYSNMYRAVQLHAHRYGYTVRLFDTNNKEHNELKGIEVGHNSSVDGLIFCSIEKSPAVINELLKLEIPIVVSNKHNELHFDTIYSERGYGIYLATKCLLGLGHTRVAYAGGFRDSYINSNRRNGYLRALDEYGIPAIHDYIFEMDFTMDAGYKAGVYFASLKQRPTAICAANDIIAMGILMAFNAVGIKVPEEISITGEDNIEFTKILRPSLTTVSNNPEFFAEKACEMLFDRLNGKYDGKARLVISPRELIIRESTKQI